MTEQPNHPIGYVVKTYPRFSETFILNEILAHERAGLSLELFALRSSTETCFHEALARVRSPLSYVRQASEKADGLWAQLRTGSRELPGCRPTLERFHERPADHIDQAITLARLVRARGIGHLHAHFATVASSVAQIAASMAGIGYSFTAHAKDIFQEAVDMRELEEKIAGARAVVTVSDFNRRYLRQHFRSHADKIVRIYNGLDLEAFPFVSAQARKPLILAVGRLVEKKGFEHLIDACALLRERAVEFRCEIVGQGRLYDSLAERIAGAGLSAQVAILGAMSQHGVRAKLAEASLLAAPCVVAEDADRDGLPTVLLEAMACGTACVSTDVTGIPEVLVDGQTGLMVEQRNARQLADACERLLGDANARVGLARNARALIEARFDIDKNTRALREILASSGAASLRRAAV